MGGEGGEARNSRRSAIGSLGLVGNPVKRLNRQVLAHIVSLLLAVLF